MVPKVFEPLKFDCMCAFVLALFYGRTGITGKINRRTKVGCVCSMCGMGCLFYCCFLCVWGGGGWDIFDLFCLPSIYSFPLFSRFLSSSFWVTALYLTDILKEQLNSKQQTYQPFRGINFKVTKSGRNLEYFLNLTLFCPETNQ